MNDKKIILALINDERFERLLKINNHLAFTYLSFKIASFFWRANDGCQSSVYS